MKYFWVTFKRPISPIVQCTMGENSHFSVTSQNIFSQSQKYFDTSIIYFLKNIWLQSNLQFSSKLEMSISFKWKVLENFFFTFLEWSYFAATFETISKDFIIRKVKFGLTDTWWPTVHCHLYLDMTMIVLRNRCLMAINFKFPHT